MAKVTSGVIEAIRASRERLVDVVVAINAAANRTKEQTGVISTAVLVLESIRRLLMVLLVLFVLLVAAVIWQDWVFAALWLVLGVAGLLWARKPFGNSQPPVAAKAPRFP